MRIAKFILLIATTLCINSNAIQEGIWTQLGADMDGEANGDKYGGSVSISGNGKTMAAGAIWNDANGDKSGQVRISDYNGRQDRWNQVGDSINGKGPDENFGYAVSLSEDGRTVAISARPWNVYIGGANVRVYRYSEIQSNWIQLGDDFIGEDVSDRFGCSLSLSQNGNIVAIGADYNDGSFVESGHVRVYEYNEIQSQWIQLGDDIEGEAAEDYSGRSVSLSEDGTILAIGAGSNNGNGDDSGHVRIYQYIGTNWIQLGNDIDGEAAGDYMGLDVSISLYGNTVAISSRYNDANGINSGRVSMYKYYGSDWIQIGNHIDGVTAWEYFGGSLSISEDGKRVAIGTPGDGSYLTPDSNGVVRIYEVNEDETAWDQVGDAIVGEYPDDGFGKSVSMSRNGRRVAIGGPLNRRRRGHVRVFKYVVN